MKISQIITEEVAQMLAEVDGEQVAAALSKIEELPDDVAQKIIAKLEPVAKAAGEKLAGKEGAVTEVIENDPLAIPSSPVTPEEFKAGLPGNPVTRAAASIATNIPGGLDLGATYLAALDRKTPASLRVAFLIAVVNLLSPVDLGSFLGLDFLGPLGMLDDYLLVKKLIIDRYKKHGYPKEEHFDRVQELAGEKVENPEATPQEKGLPGDYRPPAGGPAQAARKARRAAERGEEELQEMKIKTSQLYKIIQEELEVVLTNEEAKEIFDLDMSALLDEMVNEVDLRPEFIKDLGMRNVELCKQKAAGNMAAQCDEEELKKYLAHQKEAEGLEEAEDKSFSKAAKEIEKKGTEGVFTAKAKKAGMGVQAYAAKVLKKGSKASTKTKRQAAFAKGAATVARENK